VIHDEAVDRTTDGSGEVAGLTLRELRVLDAGKGERIPTLGEVFSTLRGRAGVNIELKGAGTAEPVHDFLKHQFAGATWRVEDVLVTSFDWGMLGRMRELSDEIRVGPLVYEDMKEALAAASELRAYSVNPYHKKTDIAYVAEAHGAGLKVYPWTVNEPTDIRRVIEMGVDGVISDYPDRV
jgi:glycerophosphoryl diester phosphodiesterase